MLIAFVISLTPTSITEQIVHVGTFAVALLN